MSTIGHPPERPWLLWLILALQLVAVILLLWPVTARAWSTGGSGGVGIEVDPTVPDRVKSIPACGEGQVPKWQGQGFVCADDLTAEAGGDMLQSVYDKDRNGAIDEEAIVSSIARVSQLPTATSQLTNNSGFLTTDTKWDGSTIVGAGGAAQARTTLSLVPGTTIQAWDADLDDLADGTLTGSKIGTGISAANITTGALPAAQMPTGMAAKINNITVTQAVNLDTLAANTAVNNAKVSYTPATPGAIGTTTPSTATFTGLTVGGDGITVSSNNDGVWGQFVFNSDPAVTNGWMLLHPKANPAESITVDIPNVTGELIIKVTAPTTATEACTAGVFAWSAGFLYVCVGTNTWQRAALSTW